MQRILRSFSCAHSGGASPARPSSSASWLARSRPAIRRARVRRHTWPLEDGTQYGLIAECNIVVLSGLTQAQLDNFFETSMSMIMGFFADLEVALPDFVDWDSQDRRPLR